MTINTGNMSDSFEEFRREKRMRSLQKELKSRMETRQGQIMRIMEDQEQTEVTERRIKREMQEFFEESTRLAAQVLADVAKTKAEEIANKINQEMQEFFADIMTRAEDTVEGIKFTMPGGGVTDIETHMDRDTIAEFGGSVPDDIKVGSETVSPAEVMAMNARSEPDPAEKQMQENLPPAETELYIPEASTPEEAEPQTPFEEEDIAPDPSSSSARLMESLSEDPVKLKEALTALFRAGVITRDQAREIFLAKRQEA